MGLCCLYDVSPMPAGCSPYCHTLTTGPCTPSSQQAGCPSCRCRYSRVYPLLPQTVACRTWRPAHPNTCSPASPWRISSCPAACRPRPPQAQWQAAEGGYVRCSACQPPLPAADPSSCSAMHAPDCNDQLPHLPCNAVPKSAVKQPAGGYPVAPSSSPPAKAVGNGSNGSCAVPAPPFKFDTPSLDDVVLAAQQGRGVPGEGGAGRGGRGGGILCWGE